MKKSELFFSFLQVPIDALMIILAFVTAYYLRKYQGEVVSFWPFTDYLKFILGILPFWIIIFALEGLYSGQKTQQGLNEFAKIFLAVSSGIMLVVAWIFLSRTFFFSRLIIIYSWFICIILVTLGRQLRHFLQRYLYRFNVGVHRLILIGKNDLSYNILKEIQNNHSLGYKFFGFISAPDDKNYQVKEHFKILGPVTDLETIINKSPVDDLILTSANLSDNRILRIIQFCQDNQISFKQIPNLFEVHTSNISLSTLAGIPIVEFKRTPLDGWGKIIKQILDIIFSFFTLIILSPIYLIIGLAIKFDSPGPIIYKNKRVGENGQTFYLYKFRSMRIAYCTGEEYGGKNAEKYEKKLIKEKNSRKGPVYKIVKDPRRTTLGRFIERTSLDELPQFFNVLMGNISIVGPRPHQPREVAGYQQWQKKVLRIKPGITGMAQISGRSDLDFDEEARLDIYYIENWSLWLDVRIVFKTPGSIIRSRKSV